MSRIAIPHPQTRWWHRDGERIVCDLCPRECRLQDGQRGFCFVRKNEGGEMQLTTYGRSTGFCIDPIEKKPLNHFLPGTPVLSFGTAGCNLGCKFCQNWDISKSREIEILSAEASPEGIVAAAKSHGCRSIAFTYNDPVVWAEYAIETAKAAHAENIKTVAVTAGYISPEARGDFFKHIDAANVDLKAFTDDFYRKLAFARLDPILETLVWLKNESDTWFELTNLIIPDENDSADEFHRLCDWVLENLGDEVPVHFTAFHPDFKMRDKPATPHEKLIEARQIAIERGIKYAYVGNVLDRERQSTFCPECSEMLIERDHYAMGVYEIADGKCAKCSEKIAGVFENDRGEWGRKRLPISISKMSSQTNNAPAFSSADGPALTTFARAAVGTAVAGRPASELAPGLAATLCVGVFVSLKRGHQLRACLGNLNEDEVAPLGTMIEAAASRAGVADTRFPSVHPLELSHLKVEVSVMHDLKIVEVDPENRPAEIEIGTHGLIISHPQGRGLLLPQVASERGWDAVTFLDQLCLKAGLPVGFWKKPATTLKTFRGEIFESDPTGGIDLEPMDLPESDRDSLLQIVQSGFEKETRDFSVSSKLVRPQPTPIGILLECQDGKNALALQQGASLIDLVKQATQSITRENSEPAPLARLVILSHPIALNPTDDFRRFDHVSRGTVMARLDERMSFVLKSDTNSIITCLAQIGIDPNVWPQSGAEITIFQSDEISPKKSTSTSQQGMVDDSTLLICETQKTATQATQGGIRSVAVAGTFYPATPDAIQTALDQFFFRVPADAILQDCRGIMLPHAGWEFCGDIIAETISQAKIPERIVIIGPKHTPHGANWSVSGDAEWQLPHAKIPVDTEGVQFLADHVPALEIETDAHRDEHGIEVLLPFLLWANPRLKIIPIALGAAELDDLKPLADALAEWRADVIAREDRPPLFVISSDMNHFADDAENRRRDELALEQMCEADPAALFQTCVENDISMCGMRPAVAVLEALNSECKCEVEITKYDTSAKVSRDSKRVVGYAGALLK